MAVIGWGGGVTGDCWVDRGLDQCVCGLRTAFFWEQGLASQDGISGWFSFKPLFSTHFQTNEKSSDFFSRAVYIRLFSFEQSLASKTADRL